MSAATNPWRPPQAEVDYMERQGYAWSDGLGVYKRSDDSAEELLARTFFGDHPNPPPCPTAMPKGYPPKPGEEPEEETVPQPSRAPEAPVDPNEPQPLPTPPAVPAAASSLRTPGGVTWLSGGYALSDARDWAWPQEDDPGDADDAVPVYPDVLRRETEEERADFRRRAAIVSAGDTDDAVAAALAARPRPSQVPQHDEFEELRKAMRMENAAAVQAAFERGQREGMAVSREGWARAAVQEFLCNLVDPMWHGVGEEVPPQVARHLGPDMDLPDSVDERIAVVLRICADALDR